ncbi:MAG: sulfoacetaldehyde acetyltransferase [Rhodospirillaceae bacterium TMED8]|nr:sulfoacetaldehyde acetyltransferase [Magnetovibrio sp.]OUT51534.1 MAG: sulfoacetaldehyde acetyltransferase [Rhodospirillaceae bacterium TMED8]
MSKITGGKAVVESIRAESVNHVFGLIGSATMEIFDALHDADDIRFIGVRDERTGTHMADGYARASGKVGVILAGQNGPGVTNLVTGLAQARAAYSSVVALAGSLSTGHVYRDAFQEVDQQSLLTPVTKKTWTVTRADRLSEMTAEAFRTAMSPRRGPVALNLPRDVLASQTDWEEPKLISRFMAGGFSNGDLASLDAALEILSKTERPLIIAGGGIKNAGAHWNALELAEALNAPIATSPGHGDAVPFGHPLNAGQVGPRGNIVASTLAREADVIVALGTRLGFNTTFYSYDNLNISAKIIQIEAEPTAIGRFFPVEVGILGDAATVASSLAGEIASLRSNATCASTATWTSDFQAKYAGYLTERDAQLGEVNLTTQPAQVYKAMRAVLPEDAMISLDAGTLCLQATDALNYYNPPSLFSPLDFGLVGFSYACGLGVKAACPDRPVISLMGDGGFGMTTSEIGTAVSHDLNTVAVVLNNGCWGAEKAYQKDFFGQRYIGADVPNPPYDKLAELWGARGFRADRAKDIENALTDALSCGQPAVVEIAVDPNALYSFRRDSFQHRVGGQN